MGDFFIFDIPISIGTMLYQAIIFTVLIFVLHKFFFNKIINMLDNRRNLIVNQLKEVERFKEEAKLEYDKQISELEEAKVQAKKMRHNSEQEAKFILKKAREEANKIRTQAYTDHNKIKGA